MQYVITFNKSYSSVEEFTMRQQMWSASEAKVQNLNSKNGSYKAGHNIFSDWTDEEYMSMMGLKIVQTNDQVDLFTGAHNTTGVDWRNSKGVITPIKNQGACGSCWAFSATEAIESAYVIAGNEQVIMAPQLLVDCDKGFFKNHGCNGGWYYTAYVYHKDHKTMREADYPYTSGTDGVETECSEDAAKGVTNVSGYRQVSGDVESMKAAIEIGPINVAVSAGNDVFRNYISGIVGAHDNCGTHVDHAVVAVGWGTEDGQDYYIVRNSWGPEWGDAGFIKIAAEEGDEGVCGINGNVYFPII